MERLSAFIWCLLVLSNGLTGTNAAVCDHIKADIIFLVDASGSVRANNFAKELAFVSDFSKSFPIGPNDVQVGVVRFSDTVEEQFSLNQYYDKQALDHAIRTIVYKQGNTATNLGLDYIRQHGFTNSSGDRVDAPNIVIVLTDGQSNHPPQTALSAKTLRDSGVEIYALGIGLGIQRAELDTVASGAHHVIMVTNFDQLSHVKEQIHISLCSALDPCSNHHCQHGGTCQSSGGSASCQCTTGYTGHHCATDLCADISPDCEHMFGICRDPVKKATICRGTCGVCASSQILFGDLTTLATTTPHSCEDILQGCDKIFGVCRDPNKAKDCQKTCGLCGPSQIVFG